MNPAEPNVVLKIDVRNPSTETVGVVEIPIALTRSLSPEVIGTLGRDLVALGQQQVTPYHRLKRTLDGMAALAKQAAAEKRDDDANQIMADRQGMLSQLSRDVQSGEAVILNWDYFSEAGRGTAEGLKREIIARAKAAGMELVPTEVLAVLVPGNIAKVLADLKAALGEHPTAAI